MGKGETLRPLILSNAQEKPKDEALANLPAAVASFLEQDMSAEEQATAVIELAMVAGVFAAKLSNVEVVYPSDRKKMITAPGALRQIAGQVLIEVSSQV